MMLNTMMNVKFQKGMSQSSDTLLKEANLLAGDAMANYKTVMSFAREDQIVNNYEKLLAEPANLVKRKSHIIAGLYGFS